MGLPAPTAMTALAATQHGVVGRQQLGDLGVTRRWLDNLIRRGVLVRRAPGVFAVVGMPVDVAPAADGRAPRPRPGELGQPRGGGCLHGLDRIAAGRRRAHDRARPAGSAGPVHRAHEWRDPADRPGHRRRVPHAVGDADDPRPGPGPGLPAAARGGDRQRRAARAHLARRAARPPRRAARSRASGVCRCSTSCWSTAAATRCSSGGSSSCAAGPVSRARRRR